MTIKSAITIHHEALLREKAKNNRKLHYLHVETIGLTGNIHPVLSGITHTQEVVRARVHIKMLSGDYPCAVHTGSDRNQDISCLLCRVLSPATTAEDMLHLLTRCRGTADTRTEVISKLLNTVATHFPNNDILCYPNNAHLTQLILDPTSLNLPIAIRINPAHPALFPVLTECRNVCYAIHKDRTRQLSKIRQK